MLKKLSITPFIAVLALVLVTAALAGKSSVSLSVPKSVPVNYTMCYNPAVGPLPCWTLSFTVENQMATNASCLVVLADVPQVVFDNTVASGSRGNGSVTTPYVAGKKYLTLNLSCSDGIKAYTDTQTVRVGGL